MPIYTTKNGDLVEFNSRADAARFEQEYPDATVDFVLGDQHYDVPLQHIDGFQKRHPEADFWSSTRANQAEPKNNTQEEKTSLWDSIKGLFGKSDQQQPVQQSVEQTITPVQQDSFAAVSDTTMPNMPVIKQAPADNEIKDLNNYIGNDGSLSQEQRRQYEIQGKLRDAYLMREELSKKMEDEFSGKPGWDILPEGLKEFMRKHKSSDLGTAYRANEERIRTLEAAKDKESSGFFKAIDDELLRNPAVQTFGLSSLRDMLNLADAKGITSSGSNVLLSEDQKLMLENQVKNNATQEQYADESNTMYRYGKIAANALPFVAEFLLTGGFGNIATTGAALGRLAGTKTSNAALKWLLRSTGTLAGDVTAAAAMANTTGAAKTMSDVLGRYLGGVVQDENGNYNFEGGKSIGRSFYEGEVANILEYYTEMLGEHIPLGKVAGKVSDKLGLSKLAKDFEGITANGWGRAAKKLLERAQIQSYPSEVLEEEANIVLNSLLVGDQKLSDLVDARTQSDIWGGMLFSIGFMNALPIATGAIGEGVNRGNYYRQKNKVNNADRVAGFRMTEERWQPLREQIDSTPNEQFADMFQSIMGDASLQDYEKRAAIDYMAELTKLRGYNMGEIAKAKDAAENGVTPEQQASMDADTSYSAGYEASDEQKNELKNQYEAALQDLPGNVEAVNVDSDPISYLRNMDTAGASAEDKQRVLDYINAKAAYDGLIKRVQDDIDSEIAASDEQVNQQVNATLGMVQPVTLKNGNREAYAMNGNLVMNEDGTVNLENSDKDIIIKDKETGKLEFVPVSDIAAADAPINPDELKAQNAEAIRQTKAQEQAAIIDGTLAFADKDTYPAVGEDGNPVEVTIISHNENGTLNVGINGEASEVPMTKDALQQMVDRYKLQQAQAANMERRAAQTVEQQEAAPAGRAYRLNEEVPVTLPDGTPGTAFIQAEPNADGQYEVELQDASGNVRGVSLMTQQELNGMEVTQPEAEQEPAPTNATFSSEQINEQNTVIGRGLTKDEADTALANMEANAEVARELDLTPENWAAEFGENGEVTTPLGVVKMGDGQYLKLAREGRNGKLGMIKPTLQNPDIVVEDKSEAKDGNTERDYSYIFVKTFTNDSGERIYYFASVTVQKEGREVSVSNQEKKKNRISSLMKNGKIAFVKETILPNNENEPAHVNQAALPSDSGQSVQGDQSIKQPSADISDSKDNTQISDIQENQQENADAMPMIGEGENTEPNFGAVSPQRAHQYLYQDSGLDEADADEFVEAYKKDAEAALKKIQNKPPKPTDKGINMIIPKFTAAKKAWQDQVDLAQRQVEYWNAVEQEQAMVARQREEAAAEEAERERYMNLTEAEKAMQHDLSLMEPRNINELAAQMLGTGKVRLIQETFRKETGYKTGESGNLLRIFANEDKGGVTLAHAGELVEQEARDLGLKYDDTDANAGRNAILEVLQEVKTWGGLMHYIENARAAEKKRLEEEEVRYEAQQKDAWAQQHFNMSYEEYEAYENEYLPQYLEEENELMNDEAYEAAVEDEINRINNIQNGEATSNREGESSPEVLSGEQPAEGGRTGNAERQEPVSETDSTLQDETGSVPEEAAGNEVNQEAAVHQQIEQARGEVETNPTPAQKEAGNYKKGHVIIDGFNITIENPKGSVRSGEDANGNKWSVTMNNDYGYIRMTESVDGDHIDVFLSDNPLEGNIYVVDQVKPDGSFDEHKVMYGFPDIESAKQAYLANYSPGWQGLGTITGVIFDEFKKWIESSHRKTKPFSEYVGVKTTGEVLSDNVVKGDGYTIESYTYTTKKNKSLNMQLIKFDNLDEAGKKKLSGIARETKGWYDNQAGGFLMRNDESVNRLLGAYKQLAEIDTKQESATVPTNGYGANNTLVTKNRYDELKKKMRQKLGGQMNIGVDPEILAIGTEMALYHIEAGARKFADYANAMIKDLGDAIRPYLKSFYNGARDLPETQEVGYDKEMSPYDEVRKFDVANFDKNTVDSFATAEAVNREQEVKKEAEQATEVISNITGQEQSKSDNKASKKTKSKEAAWWSDDNRPISLNKKDYRSYMTPEAVEYFSKFKSEDGSVDFTKWAHPELAFVTAAAWDGVIIPTEELMKLPAIAKAEQRVNEKKGSLNINSNEEQRHVEHLLDAEHGSAVFENGKLRKYKDENGKKIEDFSGVVRQEKKAFIVVGRPAGGKSSVFANRLSYENGARIIDSDTVKPWLQGYDGGYGAGYVQLASAEIASEAIIKASDTGDNIVLPRIGGSSVMKEVIMLREKGYDVQIFYNEVSEQTSIMRAASRFAQEGRYLSLDYLTRIKNKDSLSFRNFALAKLNDYYESINGKGSSSRAESAPAFLAGRGDGSGSEKEGLPRRDSRRGGSEDVSGVVPDGLRSGRDVGRGQEGSSGYLSQDELIFSYAEWKSNDVAFGEKPKEIWNSKSGKPMPEVQLEASPKESKKEKAQLSLDLFAQFEANNESNNDNRRENRQSNDGLPQRESAGSRSADNNRLGQNIQESRNVQGRDSGLSTSTSGDLNGSERSNGRISQLETQQPTEVEPKNTHNFRLERGQSIAPTSPKARYDANIAAIKKMQELMSRGAEATPDDMKVLAKFSGWGGLGGFINDSLYKRQLEDLLGTEGYNEAALSANSAFYTPANVIDVLWDVAKRLGFKGGNVLEGSAGIGDIIGHMPTDISQRSSIEAVEVDEVTGNILKLLYPDAKVNVKGFEKTKIANGSVDLAITNVPFVTGLRVFDDSGDKDLSKLFGNIHDFCIAKNVRKLREGGIGIFITSSGTMDRSDALRAWVTNEGNADFIGAFRLNNKTFGGTNVTSDIIIIRKRVNGQHSEQAINVGDVTAERVAEYETGETKRKNGTSVPVVKTLSMLYNKYFMEHPENMAGKMEFGFEHGDSYRPESAGLYPNGQDQNKMLGEWLNSLPNGLDLQPAQNQTIAGQNNNSETVGDNIKEGQLISNSKGEICISRGGSAVPLGLNTNKVKGHSKQECLQAYDKIKKALNDVLDYQVTNENDKGLKPLLSALNKAYDDFVATYGYLNKNISISFLRNDVDFASIAALESYEESGSKDGGKEVEVKKTAVFNGRVVNKEAEPTPKNVSEAVIVSIYKHGRLDVPYMAEKLGMDENEVKKEIINSGLGFENPITTELEVNFEYLSGNVREKLEQAKEANENGRYDKNIKELEKVIPSDIPAHLIEFSIGSSWVTPKLYQDYIKDRTGKNVTLSRAGGSWAMHVDYGYSEKNTSFGVRSELLQKVIPGTELIDAAMNNKTITVKESHKDPITGETITTIDKEATQACANKIDEIRQDFKDWARAKMQSDPDLSNEIAKVYNDKFNNFVPRSIPNEFVPKHFVGASTRFQLREHQGKAAVRATMQPVLFAHEVGTGKTFTMITAAMEMRRLGMAKKPMIVVQNATTSQFAASAKELYPNAKVLTLDETDRTAEGRKNFYAKIKYNDWDMIIVPQSVFDRIPDSEERQIAYIQDKIAEKMAVMEEIANNDDSGAITRQAQKEIDALEEELATISASLADKKKNKDEKRQAKARQNAAVKAREMLDRDVDEVENFDDMEIDAILIDEAHEYKHLGFATSMQRGVKGVDPSYSKKAQGAYLKIQAVKERKNGKNVVMATGTPISNTAAEIWTFMRYLLPKEQLQAYDIYYFDDFVRNFGNITQMLEFATNGRFKENNRFAGYSNLPELVRIWSGAADTVRTREAGEVKEKIPEMETGEAQNIYLPQSRSLRSIMAAVKAELNRYDNMTGKEKKENSHIPLTMYGIAKAAAIDPRLVSDEAVDEPLSKTNKAVEETLRSLNDTKDYNGTVAIFCDNYQNKHTGFNLYEEIKRKLVENGVPEEQIFIMRSGLSDKKKAEVFAKMNKGEIRVMLGSTFTLGTGVNIQERLHTLIHLDAPNRPMDYTQRNGRILRQGNLHRDWNIPVRVLRFGVEDSLDVTAYQRLKTKGAIADSIMNGKTMMNNNQENRYVEEEEDVFGDTVAQLSGSEYAMLKNQAEKEYKKLLSKKQQHTADQIYVHNAIPKYEGQIKSDKEALEIAKSGIKKVEKIFPDGKAKSIVVGNSKFSNIDSMADFIKDVVNKRLRETEETLRNRYGNTSANVSYTVKVDGLTFNVNAELRKESVFKAGYVSYVVHTNMTYDCEELGLKSVPVSRGSFKNALLDIIENVITGNDLREREESIQNSINRKESELAQVRERNGKPFPFEKELAAAKERVEELTEKMQQELAEKEAKYTDMDKDIDAVSINSLSSADEEEEGSSSSVNETMSVYEPTITIENMSDEQLLEGIDLGGPYQDDPYSAEYDSRHMEDYDNYFNQEAESLENERPSYEEADERLSDLLRQWRRRYNTELRIPLKAQIEALDNYISELAEQEVDAQTPTDFTPGVQPKQEDSNTNTYVTTTGKKVEYTQLSLDFDAAPAEQKQSTPKKAPAKEKQRGIDLTQVKLRELKEGEVCHAERRFTRDNTFDLTGGKEKIESHDDIAYIFRCLQDKAIEHTFVVLVKKGEPTILHIGMGTINQAPVDTAPILALVNQVKPDTIYFIHNHPSGNLKPSREDMNISNRLAKIAGGVPVRSMIIDTYKHQYVMFDNGTLDTGDVPSEVGDTRSIPLFAFDERKYEQGFEPNRITSSTDVFNVTQKLRFGDNGKIGYIAADMNANIMGSLYLNVESPSEIGKKEIQEMLQNTVLMNGSQLFLYGSAKMDKSTMQKLIDKFKELSGGEVHILDILQINENDGDHSNYYSFHDNGVLEPETPYGFTVHDSGYEPTNTGTGYKVFVLKDGKLYPPMVANPNGEATPVGVWLEAEAAPVAGTSKTGRPQVKAGGKGTQGGSGTLAYRPGWHLGEIPYAKQFNRKDAQGERNLFPNNFVWAEVEYANDVNYQDEAHRGGTNANGKYQHSLAGLKRVPVNGSYRYRTNPDPTTDEWIITGAMKVNRILTPSEVDDMVRAAGREPQQRQEGAVTDEQVQQLNERLFPVNDAIPEMQAGEDIFAYAERVAEADRQRRERMSREADEAEEPEVKEEPVSHAEAVEIARQFEKEHKGAGKTIILDESKGKEGMIQQLMDEGITRATAERWLDRDDIAIYSPYYDRVVILKPSVGKAKLNSYLWHENVHRAIDKAFGRDADRRIDITYRKLFLLTPGTLELDKNVRKAYEGDTEQVIKEEYLAHVFEDAAMSSYDVETYMDKTIDARGKDGNLSMLKEIVNYIKYGNKEGNDNGRSSGSSERNLRKIEEERIAGQVRNAEGTDVRNGTEGERSARQGVVTPFLNITMRDKALARDEYEKMIKSNLYQFREAVQDSMLGLRALYKAVLGKDYTHIEDVPGFENAYLAENRMSSMSAAEQHDYFNRFMTPLLETIGKLTSSNDANRKELTEYMMAKHGLERNIVMAERDARIAQQGGGDYDKALQKNRERDYAGLTSLTGEADVAAAEIKAGQIVSDYESAHDTALIDELWDRTKAATHASLEKLYQSGLMSYDTYQRTLAMFQNYIPLRGWEETTSDEVYGYLTSNDSPLLGSVLKKAGGRSSVADDPIAYIAQMADKSIMEGNRNRMKQTFLNFVLNHPSDLVSVSDIWMQHDDVNDEWIAVFPELDPADTAEIVEQKMAAFENTMTQLSTADPAHFKRSRENPDIPYKVINKNKREHQVLVKRNGRAVLLTINGNPRAAQALNGLTNPDVDVNGVVGNLLRAGEYINRNLSAFYTTRNPDFVISNFMRDMVYSNVMTWVKESPRYARRFHRNVGKLNPATMRKLLGKWESGTLDENNYTENLFRQFMLNGGETGYTSVRDLEAHKKNIADELKKQGSVGRKAWDALGMQLDLMNRSVENCARFAAFVTSREMGRSVERSIHDAKEVSVNFNKKGSGGKMVNTVGMTRLGKTGAYISGLGRVGYVFWNAGVQGMTNFGRAGKRHTGKALAGAAAMYMLGQIIPLLWGGDGDDDDKNAYYNLPEYIRRSSICINAGDQWITIPLPIELRGIYGMGELATGVITGNERYSNSELAFQIASQLSQILPLDMLEGGGGLTPLIPSSAKPFVEAYMLNKRWSGLPVYKDTPFNKKDPEWTKAYKSADQTLVNITKWLNEVSGGDDFKKGAIDINPAKIEYLLSGVLGGYENTVEKLKKMGETAMGQRDFEWRNILLANRLLTSGDESTEFRKLQNEYYRYKDEADETKRLLKKYENADNEGIMGMAEKVDFLYNSDEYRRYEIYEDFKDDITAYQDMIKESVDKDEKRQLEREMYDIIKEMLSQMKKKD